MISRRGFVAGLAACLAAPAAARASIYGGARRFLGTGMTPEALALFAAMTTPPTAARAEAINALILDLKNADIWRVLDVLYVLAAADSQAALLNWKRPGTFTATESGTLTFEADLGYTSNGTDGYLDTGWAPSTNGVNFTNNNCHLGVVVNTNVTGATFAVGAGATLRLTPRSGTNGSGRINDSTTTTHALSPASSVGHTIMTRSNPTQHGWSKHGSAIELAAANSGGVGAGNLLICGNISSTFYAGRIAAAHAGGNLTDAQLAAFYNALASYP